MHQFLLATAFVVAAAFTVPAIAVAESDSINPVVEQDAGHAAIVRPTRPGGVPRATAIRSEHTTVPLPVAGSSIDVTIPACFADVDGTVESVDTTTSPLGVGGTTSNDLDEFARAFNATRVANCLQPIPLKNFHYNACLEQRLFWMAEDPSEDPTSAWGHLGSERSDGVPSVGCDANLAGGSDNTGATVAQKWWDSLPHRAALYRPADDISGACIVFAMTHGGVPDEASTFTRAAARWVSCDNLP